MILMMARMAKRAIILKPVFRQRLMICEETMAVREPNVLMNPIPINLTCVGYS